MQLDNFILPLRLTIFLIFSDHSGIFPEFPGISYSYVNLTIDTHVTICYNLITFDSGGNFTMADENAVLTYKGRPLMRKDNIIYYGSMADSHIVMLQVMESKKQGDLDVATRVSVQLQLTDPNARSRDRVVKKSEKDGFYTALDVGSVWLERALAGK